MYPIRIEAVRDWQNYQNVWAPGSLNVVCPYCQTLGNITLKYTSIDFQVQTIHAIGYCPGGCNQVCRFWIHNPVPHKPNEAKPEQPCNEIFMYPKPAMRESIVAKGILPERIFRAYTSTLKALNHGDWENTLSSCGRTLEGILKMKYPEFKDVVNLGSLLNKLAEKNEIHEPILNMAEVLKTGRNLGAHFDLSKEPTKEIAETSVDFLEYLIEYLYLLDNKAKELEQRINSLPGVEELTISQS